MEEDQKDQENRGGGGGVCRQSSTRWTPTPDQIRILKDLYYNRNIRSPNGEQIQSISATLRQYGKIEGKNVFYWFQNHKARERQKKRFTSHHPPYNNKPPYTTSNYITSPSAPPGFFTASTSSSPSGLPTYASLTMDKTFREGYNSNNNNIGVVQNNNYGVGGWVDPYNYNNSSSCYSFFDMQKSVQEEEDLQNDDEEHDDQDQMMIETLPLFPTQREEFVNSNSNNSCYSYTSNWYSTSDHHDYNALELTLNSYTTSHRRGGPHY